MINGTRLAFQEGESVVLVCQTDACRPSADIYWIMNATGIRNVSVDVIALPGHLFITTGSLSYTAHRYDNGLTLACDPPTIYNLQSFYRVIENQSLNVTCKADSNPQPHHIDWFPRGEAYDSSVLFFNSVTRSNSGNYTCTAINNMTSMTGVQRTGSDTRWIEVDVLFPPTILSPTSYYKVIENQTLDVTCQVISNPTPYQIFWSPGGESYFSRLYFKSVSRNNSGNYTCTARNTMTTVGAQQIGVDRIQIEMDVLYPPTVFIEIETEICKVRENQTLNITCRIISNPPPDQIVWSPSGEASDPYRLYFKSVSRNNSGNYSCTARNTMTPTDGGQHIGSDTRQIAVDILCKPGIPTEFNISGRGHDFVTLEWTPGYQGNIPQYFFIEYRILPDGKWLTVSPASEDTHLKKQYFTVYGLQQETTYEFQMFAINKVGLSNYTKVINETTPGIIGDSKRNTSPIAPVVGGVFGAIAVVVIVIITVVLGKRRGFCKKNSTKQEENLEKDVPSSTSRTDPKYSNIRQIGQINHKNPSINKTTDLELTDIEIGEETNVGNSLGNTYDALHQYANTDMSTYITLRSKNPTEGEQKIYENTKTPVRKGRTKEILSIPRKENKVRSGYNMYENTNTLTERNQ
ncbi:hypothetical protein ACJMK2_027306 [Sinanodonta woodiana]|uniref:Uncharacterized protein n=1 Tax=Sinanodonta woodiana TaxID=1069815 RepID=A0ABD3XM83_SINWO